jgi:hypothetical protein
MCGYVARELPAIGVHDALFARALAFGGSDRPFVVVVCDLIDVDDALVESVRARVPGAIVWLSATHTHSGPEIGGDLALHGSDARIRERVISGAAAAARAAIESMRPVRASWASVPVDRIATNRDYPAVAVDLSLDLLCLSDTDGPSRAVLGSFACHPTVLGAENLQISADMNGAFCVRLRSLLPGTAWVALATGAAGDVSTRHTRRAQNFDEVDRLGFLVARQAAQALDGAASIRLDLPVVAEDRVSLAGQGCDLVENANTARERLLREREALLRAGDLTAVRTIDTSLEALALQAVDWPAEIEATVCVAKIGEVTLVGVPGELYNRLGAAIRHANERVLLLGYTNGYIGYIPTLDAYTHELDYEVLASRLAPGAGEDLVEAVTGLMANRPQEVAR